MDCNGTIGDSNEFKKKNNNFRWKGILKKSFWFNLKIRNNVEIQSHFEEHDFELSY